MSADYDVSQIQVISGLAGVRNRPGMYFGSTTAAATEQFVYELVANVVDCYLAETATFAAITINNNQITVIDDGPGLPFDILVDDQSDEQRISKATKIFTTLHFTSSEGGHAPHLHLQHMHGVGLAVLNAASSDLRVQSWRQGVLWAQQFSQGVPLSAPIIIEPSLDSPIHQRGTRIDITPDPKLFQAARPRSDVVRWHLFEMVHLAKGMEICLQRERFHAPDGLRQLIPFVDRGRSVAYAVPKSSDRPFQATLKSDNVSIDAIACASSHFQHISWVNGALSLEGGSHLTGFLEALRVVNWQPELVMIHVVMFDPEYAGPQKTRLAIPKIAHIVQTALLEPLQKYLQSR